MHKEKMETLNEPRYMNRRIKDSVFTLLFQRREYLLQLYLTLHPEDTSVKEEDLKPLTLENVLTVGEYNDLGFQVGDRVIVLTEAQSTFSVNLSCRAFLYLADTYQEYIREKKLNLYRGKPVKLPRPELFAIYTGERENVPKVLRLSDLYEGNGAAEVTVQVLQGDGSGSIVDQYVRFCKIADTQRKKYGYTKKAVIETIQICQSEGILVPFLRERKGEVEDIMFMLFDQEQIREIHEYNLIQDAREEGREEGRREGRREGQEEVIRKSLLSLMETLHLSMEQAMDALQIPPEKRAGYQSGL